MILRKVNVLTLLLFYCFNSVDLLSQHPVLLIISYDAFRYDYLSRGVTPVLSKLRDSGTYAEYLNNVFATKTFPNHQSLATGVYPEFHGVLGSHIYDGALRKDLSYGRELWTYSNDTLPIWAANEKKGGGRHSATMMWPGSEFEYAGIRPTYSRPWNYSVPWDKRIDGIIEWIINPEKPANLAMLYIEEPDYHGHSFGIDNPKFISQLKNLDNMTQYLLDKLKYYNLTDKVNIFFVSDHGMISTTKKNIIDLRKFVSSEYYDSYDTSPGLHIYPKTGKADIVYKALKTAAGDGSKFNVYKLSEVPDHFHFKNNRRAPPILALANPPYVFHDLYASLESYERQWNYTFGEETPFGVHGYDNGVKSMKPFFVAVGPRIKSNYKIEPFRTVDLYSLWAHMSGFPELAEHTNGTMTVVSRMLRVPESKYSESQNAGNLLFGLILLGVINLAVYFIYRRWYLNSRGYLNRFAHESAESRQKLLDAEEET